MMNEQILVLMKQDFSVYIYPSKDEEVCVLIIKRSSNETASGRADTPEKALSNAMLDWIHRYGRIE